MDWYYILLIVLASIGVGVGGTFLGNYIIHLVWERNRTSSEKYKKRVLDYQLLNLETDQEGAPVLFLGDSITENFPIQEFFPGKHYVNRGICGDRADWLHKRLENNVFGIKPKKIILLIGVNDLNHDYGVSLTYQNILKSIELIRENLPTTELILSAVYPVNPELNGSAKARAEMKNRDIVGKIEELNAKLRAYAKEKSLRFNNTAEALKDASGLFNKKYTDDGVHPNFAGYRAISKYLKEKIKI